MKPKAHLTRKVITKQTHTYRRAYTPSIKPRYHNQIVLMYNFQPACTQTFLVRVWRMFAPQNALKSIEGNIFGLIIYSKFTALSLSLPLSSLPPLSLSLSHMVVKTRCWGSRPLYKTDYDCDYSLKFQKLQCYNIFTGAVILEFISLSLLFQFSKINIARNAILTPKHHGIDV